MKRAAAGRLKAAVGAVFDTATVDEPPQIETSTIAQASPRVVELDRLDRQARENEMSAVQELQAPWYASFEFLHQFLQCDLRFVGILRDVFGQEKSPRALILKGFLIFPASLEILRDYPGGGEEEDRTPDLRIANATLSQLSYPPTAARSLAKAARDPWHPREPGDAIVRAGEGAPASGSSFVAPHRLRDFIFRLWARLGAAGRSRSPGAIGRSPCPADAPRSSTERFADGRRLGGNLVSTELLAQTQLYPFHLRAWQIDKPASARSTPMTSPDPRRATPSQRPLAACRPGSPSATSNGAVQLDFDLANRTARAEIAENAFEVLRRYLGCAAVSTRWNLCSAR
jgi:hypothetical protein